MFCEILFIMKNVIKYSKCLSNFGNQSKDLTFELLNLYKLRYRIFFGQNKN